jgi:glycine betaine/proline transport system substrate-binding protein
MTTPFTKTLAASLGLLAASGTAQADDVTIKIALNDWTGQHVSARLAGEALKQMGFAVEYVEADAVGQHELIAEGKLDLNPEIWTNNVGEVFPHAVSAGAINIVGDLGLEPREGWYYPPYMEAKCPGLPSYQALYDCAAAFAGSGGKGQLLAYPETWGSQSIDQVAVMDLPFTAEPAASEEALIQSLQTAVAGEEPILAMFWQPHWLHSDIDLKPVEWDSTSAGCVAGVNQTRGDACGFAQAAVTKITSAEFASRWPEAYDFVTAFTLDNDTRTALIRRVNDEGLSVEEAVAQWLAANGQAALIN